MQWQITHIAHPRDRIALQDRGVTPSFWNEKEVTRLLVTHSRMLLIV